MIIIKIITVMITLQQRSNSYVMRRFTPEERQETSAKLQDPDQGATLQAGFPKDGLKIFLEPTDRSDRHLHATSD